MIVSSVYSLLVSISPPITKTVYDSLNGLQGLLILLILGSFGNEL